MRSDVYHFSITDGELQKVSWSSSFRCFSLTYVCGQEPQTRLWSSSEHLHYNHSEKVNRLSAFFHLLFEGALQIRVSKHLRGNAGNKQQKTKLKHHSRVFKLGWGGNSRRMDAKYDKVQLKQKKWINHDIHHSCDLNVHRGFRSAEEMNNMSAWKHRISVEQWGGWTLSHLWQSTAKPHTWRLYISLGSLFT